MRATNIVKRSAECASQKANKFVRFSYRNPPPWNSSEQVQQQSLSLARSWRFRKRSLPNSSVISEDNSEDTTSWNEISCKKLSFKPLENGQDASMVPVLAHGMEVALRGDGLYPLEAPWTKSSSNQIRDIRSYNSKKFQNQPIYYKDSLRKIVQPEQIAWHKIPGYIPAARDVNLHEIAAITKGVEYSSSTSSIIPALVSLYHLISNFRDTDLLGGLSNQLNEFPIDFSKVHRLPVAIMISRNDTNQKVYSINAHSGEDNGPTILRDLGHSMERMLTTCPIEFKEKFVLSKQNCLLNNLNLNQLTPHGDEEQFYHYSQVSKFALRAQIDCRNEKTGEFFDIKTRAVAPIRYDLPNYMAFSSHRLKHLRGRCDSYEREFYDMVRSVFLKYALQLRIGRMSGALVAYHNTTEVLGVEFLSLSEIQSYVFGNDRWADIAFGTIVQLLERITDQATKTMLSNDCNSKLKLVLYTEWSKLRMLIYAQKITDEENDPFGPNEFMKRDKSFKRQKYNSIDKSLSADGLWHFDSEIHNGIGGISAIGNHISIRNLGGEKIKSESSPQRFRCFPNNELLNPSHYDTEKLDKDSFKIWELKVAPFINNERTPRNTWSLNENDQFHLKYNLSEIKEAKTEHIAKFVSSLGRIYIR